MSMFSWQNHEDFELKKLLMTTLVLISADSASIQVQHFKITVVQVICALNDLLKPLSVYSTVKDNNV